MQGILSLHFTLGVSPLLCELLVGALAVSSLLLLSPSTRVRCDGRFPGE